MNERVSCVNTIEDLLQAGGGKGDWAEARQILIVVGDKGVAKGAEHDEAEDGTESGREEDCGDFGASTETATREENDGGGCCDG